MKDLVGSPGTWTSLMLRLLQSVCAAASSLNMASTYGVSTNHYRAFWYLIVTMAVQSFWSLLLACADVYSLKTKADLHSPGLVKTFVVGDWVR
ncbi:hypothetical protein PR202_gb12375 [Eleusine coracana subsp. coracana]|uniref:CASP-like protein n=1 Tax=Eleusine coracana subsp. coracana TaxID=191504 RepID=A0AAV5EQB3_ELECO|nr:hypothetical protein QOZ80_7BG0587780 [Eleusine coracana subsp. coracana]GJN24622.1 hypothetical protein PR202_gb12375 [Eleusine coracana subsp. coracana]